MGVFSKATYPQLGRWLSADPIGFDGGLNLYTYVGNSPTNRVDPSGLVPGWVSNLFKLRANPYLVAAGIAVGVGGFCYQKWAETYKAKDHSWWQQADAIAKNAANYGIDPGELQNVMDYFKFNYRNMIRYNCPYAQDTLFNAMKARFPNPSSFRFRKAFIPKTSLATDINPDHVVELIPVMKVNGRTVDNPNPGGPTIGLYTGADNGYPLRETEAGHSLPEPDSSDTPLWLP